MKETIIIITDVDHEIGLGHVYRSLNLDKELKKNNFKIVFLTKSKILKKSASIMKHFFYVFSQSIF